MTMTATWSSGAFGGVAWVAGAVDGWPGLGAGGVVAALAVGEAVAVGVGVGVAVTVGVGVDVTRGVRWVHAPIATSSTMMPVQAVTRRRSAMQEVPAAVDDPVPDKLVVLGDAGGRHQLLQALLEVGPGLLEPG